MSTLTKLFVVLLIICSILLTAATVTFVNSVDDYKTKHDAAAGRITLLEQERRTVQDEAAAARLREQQAVGDSNRRVTELEAQLTEARQQIGQREAQMNELKTQLAVQNATQTDLGSALKVAQQNLTDLQKRLDGIIGENDKIRVANAELTGANTDLSKRLDETERDRRWLAEQVNQLRSNLTQAQAELERRGITLESLARRPAAPTNLRGVIRDVRRSDGVTYATISLGSNQRVSKGMQFNVLDQRGNTFLGTITIESVERNDSFGRLEGPRVAQIQPDNLVLSSAN